MCYNLNSMKHFFDKFLLGVLWLITATLAAAFWMNANYGFNILSSAHWAYLSELQAHRTNVKQGFYISLIVALVIALVGLYLIVRHKSKQISPTHDTKPEQKTIQEPTPAAPEPKQQIVSSSRRPIAPAGFGVGVRNTALPVPHPAATAYAPQIITPPAPNIEQPQNPQYTEISSIFESAGYIVKKSNKIGKLIKPVFAVGYDQTIWLGSSGISPAIMQDAIESLVAIFDDTLGDTAQDIEIHGIILNPTDTENLNSDLIATFDNLTELKDFIEQNAKPEDFDNELFDAFSTYIDTVIGYVGK